MSSDENKRFYNEIARNFIETHKELFFNLDHNKTISNKEIDIKVQQLSKALEDKPNEELVTMADRLYEYFNEEPKFDVKV